MEYQQRGFHEGSQMVSNLRLKLSWAKRDEDIGPYKYMGTFRYATQ